MTTVAPAANVIVLSDWELSALAWQALLEKLPGLAVAAAVTTPEAVPTVKASATDAAVLLDAVPLLPEQVAALAAALPPYGILCLVPTYELDEIVALLRAGAGGVISRNATVVELSLALVAAARGEIVLPPNLAARALTALARGELRSQQEEPQPLTDREGEVLTLLAQGLTNKDIAQSLFLSVRTVEAHLRSIYGKLNVSSRTEAVLWAVQHNVGV